MRRTVALVGLGISTVLLAGCTRSLAADDIERELERRLSTSDFVPEVTCDDDLAGDVGASITCESVLAEDLEVEITVTATHVDGDQVLYTFAVEPTGLGAASPSSTNPSSTSPSSTSPSSTNSSSTSPASPPSESSGSSDGSSAGSTGGTSAAATEAGESVQTPGVP
jgi:hypothetical protein